MNMLLFIAAIVALSACNAPSTQSNIEIFSGYTQTYIGQSANPRIWLKNDSVKFELVTFSHQTEASTLECVSITNGMVSKLDNGCFTNAHDLSDLYDISNLPEELLEFSSMNCGVEQPCSSIFKNHMRSYTEFCWALDSPNTLYMSIKDSSRSLSTTFNIKGIFPNLIYRDLNKDNVPDLIVFSSDKGYYDRDIFIQVFLLSAQFE